MSVLYKSQTPLDPISSLQCKDLTSLKDTHSSSSIDTTGSHQFPAMQRLNITKGHAFFLVYSITSKQSLEELIPIYRQIIEVKAGTGESNIPILLVGNKCDDSYREVSNDFAIEVISKVMKGCAFIETSAKTSLNVYEAFQELLSLDKNRNISLKLDYKKSRSQLRKEKLKGHCSLM
ncbi:unnamed protein product [Oppiella nova]|uniref:Uncharacterized protein n=1 Tax=Oppiella nova TaxID=334625 RepID=A0A7R9LA30_9ACAR|nr:unnamed protein product [Oppiella nova]CAG2158937.1 unnamed protein product [Oppiella nova]